MSNAVKPVPAEVQREWDLRDLYKRVARLEAEVDIRQFKEDRGQPAGAFAVPAEVLLHGKDGTVFPMTAAAWNFFAPTSSTASNVYDQGDCEDEVRGLEECLAQRVDSEDEDDPADLMDPDEAFFSNRLGVYQLLMFLLTCGGFTVEKVQ